MATTTSDDEYDQMADDIDFAGIREEEWEAMQTQPQFASWVDDSTALQDPELSRVPINTGLPSLETYVEQRSTENGQIQYSQSAAQTPSSAYFSEDDLELDEAFLSQLDAVENQLVNDRITMAEGGSTSNECGLSTQSGCKRRRASDDVTDDLDSSFSSKKRSKMGHSGHMTEILECYEDEITCPVCFDLFSCAQLVNPCGHTLCGDCGNQWIIKKRHASCPVCRGKCDMTNPLLPNISADSFVQRHINVLSMLGNDSWKKSGCKWVEWNTRKEKWLEERAIGARKRKR